MPRRQGPSQSASSPVGRRQRRPSIQHDGVPVREEGATEGGRVVFSITRLAELEVGVPAREQRRASEVNPAAIACNTPLWLPGCM